MSKKIYISNYLKPHAEKFAKHFLDQKGIKPNSKGYKKAYDNAIQLFCRDYYESTTGIKANPKPNDTTKVLRTGKFTTNLKGVELNPKYENLIKCALKNDDDVLKGLINAKKKYQNRISTTMLNSKNYDSIYFNSLYNIKELNKLIEEHLKQNYKSTTGERSNPKPNDTAKKPSKQIKDEEKYDKEFQRHMQNLYDKEFFNDLELALFGSTLKSLKKQPPHKWYDDLTQKPKKLKDIYNNKKNLSKKPLNIYDD